MSTVPSREEALFSDALAQPPAERRAYVDHQCGGDVQLRERIFALLAAHNDAEILLRPAATSTPEAWHEEQAGDRIDRYKLLEKIGEGGCGVVWMAEQAQPVRRRVALKIIKLGMDTKAVIARFEAERQALAMMDHPNIAKVFDAGCTHTGRPYFVMELVSGIRITTFCDQHQIGTVGRLNLFMQVCHAIQHAHQKGIIHRDIKPSNILVAEQDAVPVPKVIDFGIAKATQEPLTEHTVLTALEQLVGTPAYMSPEQAELRGLDVDTRSDIYSLGVLLYELLAGRPPFDPRTLSEQGLDEIRRIVREVEPPKPSTRLTTLDEAERHRVAAQRSMAPADLTQQLRGDLDWIAMRCLEKDRARRYDSATALAADIQRHLDDEAVVARPPSAGYRLGKFIRRHRGACIAGAAIVSVIVAGAVVSAWLAVRATAAERTAVVERRNAEMHRLKAEDGRQAEMQARQEAEKQRQLAEFRLAEQRVARREAERQTELATEARNQALAAEQLAEERRAAAVSAQEEAERQKAAAESQRAEAERERNRARLAERKAQSEAAITRAVGEFLQRDLLAQASPRVQPDRDLKLRTALDRAAANIGSRFATQPYVEIAIRRTLAGTYYSLGVPDMAEKLLARALALAEEHDMADADLLLIAEDLALVYREAGKLERAEQLARETHARFAAKYGPAHRLTIVAARTLAATYGGLAKYAAAENLMRETVATARRELGPDNIETRDCIAMLASVCQQTGKTRESVELYSQLVEINTRLHGAHHRYTMVVMNDLGSALRQDRRPYEAEQWLRKTLDGRRKTDGPEHPETFSAMNNLAGALAEQGKLDESTVLLREELALRQRVQGPEHPGTLLVMHSIALQLHRQRKTAQAEAMYLDLIAVRKRTQTPGHPTTIGEMGFLAQLYLDDGKLAKAEAVYRDALQALRRHQAADYTGRATVLENIARVCDRTGRRAEAAALLREGLDLRRRVLGKADPSTLATMRQLADVERRQKNHRAAEPLLREIIGNGPDGGTHRAIACSDLGESLIELGRFEDAEPFLIAGFDGLEIDDVPDRRLAAGRLVQLYTKWNRPAQLGIWKRRFDDMAPAYAGGGSFTARGGSSSTRGPFSSSSSSSSRSSSSSSTSSSTSGGSSSSGGYSGGAFSSGSSSSGSSYSGHSSSGTSAGSQHTGPGYRPNAP